MSLFQSLALSCEIVDKIKFACWSKDTATHSQIRAFSTAVNEASGALLKELQLADRVCLIFTRLSLKSLKCE